jgi:H+-transporting ATPase
VQTKALSVSKLKKHVLELAHRGIRSLAVARTKKNSDDFEFIGILTFLDPPRPDTKHTIDCANDFGVSVKMITGDHRAIAGRDLSHSRNGYERTRYRKASFDEG